MTDVDHYADRYWNDLPQVLRYMQRRATGDPDTWWMEHLRREWCTPPRRRGLVIGCGNGWVERDLYDRGICESFDAFDVSETYLDQARAECGDRNIRYMRSDFASFVPPGRYDLVVNVAALHHAAHLYRHVARLAAATEDDGILVNWEYIGPRRNQYPPSQMEAMRRVRDALPPQFRTPHALKPTLLDAIAGDPTEAVHSNEIVRAIEDHFEVILRNDVGGGIAYQLLWNFTEPFDPPTPESEAALSTILAADEQQTGTSQVPHMFTYIIARPRRRITLAARARVEVFERIREATPQHLDGRYPADVAQQMMDRVAVRRRRGGAT